MNELRDPDNQQWDAIVIGSGMGGATLGHALTQAGRKVLFCERGKANLPPAQGRRGKFMEDYLSHDNTVQSKVWELMEDSGRYVAEVTDLRGADGIPFIPFMGAGGGGSTALYGAALERFGPEDFSPRKHYPEAAG